MALAFCYTKWQVASTIIGVTSLAQLDEDLDAWGTTLSPELLAEIDKIRWEIRDPARARSWPRWRRRTTSAKRRPPPCCKAHGVAFTEHPYEYLEHGGAQHSAQVLGFDPVHGREDAGDGRREGQAAAGADARQPQGVHQEPGAADRRQVGRALQARGRQPPQRLPGGRHLAVRHAQARCRCTSRRASSPCRRSPSTAAGAATWWASTRRSACELLGAKPVQCALAE